MGGIYMKEEMIKLFIENIESLLRFGLEEESDLFPYTIACIHFMQELKNKGIVVDLEAFSPEIQNAIYLELGHYVSK